MRNHIKSFALLADTAKECWNSYDILVCMASDHGTHVNWEGFGDHGEWREEDINIIHYYGVYPKKHAESGNM